jgi:hypothetical protein
MKGLHALVMGLCAAILVIALASGASIGPLLLVLAGCAVMMWMMMRMMGGRHDGHGRG